MIEKQHVKILTVPVIVGAPGYDQEKDRQKH